MGNLHPGNVFLSTDLDIRISDTGLNNLRLNRQSKLSIHSDFLAPEQKAESYREFDAMSETEFDVQTAFGGEDEPLLSDVWSLGMLVKLLATGSTTSSLKSLAGFLSPELLDFLSRTLQSVPGRRLKPAKLLSHPFISKCTEQTPRESDRIRDKLGEFCWKHKLEQLFLHVACSSKKQDLLRHTLRIAFDNQLYLNSHLGMQQDAITEQQAITIVCDKISVVAQQRCSSLIEGIRMVTFEQLLSLVHEYFRLLKDEASEATFTALDSEQHGYLESSDVLLVMQSNRDRLAQIHGHGFARRLDRELEMQHNKRIGLTDFNILIDRILNDEVSDNNSFLKQ